MLLFSFTTMVSFQYQDHEHQQCKIQIWEQPWRDFLEVQKLECKSTSSEAKEPTEGDKLPLLGQNLINRGKREAHTMGINGQLFGMFRLSQYTYSFKLKNELCVNVTSDKAS